jgi:hypothetical protein
LRAANPQLSLDIHMNPILSLNLSCSRQEAVAWVGSIKADKGLEVEIKPYRNKRSLDANAYMWVLLSKMAAILHTTKDELYLQMLDRYGVFTHVVVKPNVVDRVKAEWRTVRELGEVKINGQTGIQLQCYFGSSTYDTREMARLIDGVVSECKELDIETMTPAELELLKNDWGK